jgi:hypothetical protein
MHALMSAMTLSDIELGIALEAIGPDGESALERLASCRRANGRKMAQCQWPLVPGFDQCFPPKSLLAQSGRARQVVKTSATDP